MSSRETILAAIKRNQPALNPLPVLNFSGDASVNLKEQFSKTLMGIGGSLKEVNDWKDIAHHIRSSFPETSRIVNTTTELSVEFGTMNDHTDPHDFSTVNVTIMKGEFGVAENGAIWLTDDNMGDRALPYITEHLALVIHKSAIVPTLHEAYEQIGSSSYGLGTFLAGPSKTADIEQSLVLGAHGSKSLIVFLID
ncbi:MAG: hypothetical protein RI909_554 [Bacteroidota bacterium]|jgi:L-lactate dehydrogenase complex protein LldG